MNDAKISPNDIVRFLLEIFALVSLGIWGFTTWVFPYNLVFGVLAPALAILVWALFLSPKAVIALDPFAKAVVELVVMGSAALAWFAIGAPVVGIVFGLVAIVSGVLHGRRAIA